jgi:hypothetical protein
LIDPEGDLDELWPSKVEPLAPEVRAAAGQATGNIMNNNRKTERGRDMGIASMDPAHHSI